MLRRREEPDALPFDQDDTDPYRGPAGRAGGLDGGERWDGPDHYEPGEHGERWDGPDQREDAERLVGADGRPPGYRAQHRAYAPQPGLPEPGLPEPGLPEPGFPQSGASRPAPPTGDQRPAYPSAPNAIDADQAAREHLSALTPDGGAEPAWTEPAWTEPAWGADKPSPPADRRVAGPAVPGLPTPGSGVRGSTGPGSRVPGLTGPGPAVAGGPGAPPASPPAPGSALPGLPPAGFALPGPAPAGMGPTGMAPHGAPVAGSPGSPMGPGPAVAAGPAGIGSPYPSGAPAFVPGAHGPAPAADPLYGVLGGLAMRDLTLVESLLQVVEKLESHEENPDQLELLFRIDHLATRMRRNSENLLVLAGHDNEGRDFEPVPLLDVARAAISEITDYSRAQVTSLPDVRVIGLAADDLSHIVAELLDNATSKSPESAPVVVRGERTGDGTMVVSVEDAGIGIPADRLADINARLSRAPVLDAAATRHMGLYVVGRLAQRHGIRVQLRERPYGGIVANIIIPGELIRTAPDAPPTRSGRPNRGPLRPEPVPAEAGRITGPGTGGLGSDGFGAGGSGAGGSGAGGPEADGFGPAPTAPRFAPADPATLPRRTPSGPKAANGLTVPRQAGPGQTGAGPAARGSEAHGAAGPGPGGSGPGGSEPGGSEPGGRGSGKPGSGGPGAEGPGSASSATASSATASTGQGGLGRRATSPASSRPATGLQSAGTGTTEDQVPPRPASISAVRDGGEARAGQIRDELAGFQLGQRAARAGESVPGGAEPSGPTRRDPSGPGPGSAPPSLGLDRPTRPTGDAVRGPGPERSVSEPGNAPGSAGTTAQPGNGSPPLGTTQPGNASSGASAARPNGPSSVGSAQPGNISSAASTPRAGDSGSGPPGTADPAGNGRPDLPVRLPGDSTVRPGATQGVNRLGPAPSAPQPGTAQPGTAQPGTAQPGTAQPPATRQPGDATDRPGAERNDGAGWNGGLGRSGGPASQQADAETDET